MAAENRTAELTKSDVLRYLKTDKVNIDVQRCVTSTNTILKSLANEGMPEGFALIAEEQTAGRGRLGRTFHSPPGTGLYFSILLRPTISAERSLFITTAAAVAVCRGDGRRGGGTCRSRRGVSPAADPSFGSEQPGPVLSGSHGPGQLPVSAAPAGFREVPQADTGSPKSKESEVGYEKVDPVPGSAADHRGI